MFKYKNPDFNESTMDTLSKNQLKALKINDRNVYVELFETYMTMHRVENIKSKLNDDEKNN
jgi:hypothetical protein